MSCEDACRLERCKLTTLDSIRSRYDPSIEEYHWKRSSRPGLYDGGGSLNEHQTRQLGGESKGPKERFAEIL